jgi:hypothetical protein
MAATKKKKVDPVKQREKRVKIAAIVGVVLFLAVAAYEIPSMLAVMNKKPPPGSTYDPGPSSVLPNISGGAPTAAATSGQLVNTDVPPSSGEGQLVSFSVFQTKNPFTPQVSIAQTPPDSGAAPSASGANKQGADVPTGATTTPTDTTSTPTSTVPSVVPPSQSPPSTTTPTTTTPASTTPVQPTVAISVNGTVSRVSTEGTFPSGTPVFRLVSWSKGTAQIGIVGGSYATGDPTIALRVGTPVTLENQTDGKRYKIELLSTP